MLQIGMQRWLTTISPLWHQVRPALFTSRQPLPSKCWPEGHLAFIIGVQIPAQPILNGISQAPHESTVFKCFVSWIGAGRRERKGSIPGGRDDAETGEARELKKNLELHCISRWKRIVGLWVEVSSRKKEGEGLSFYTRECFKSIIFIYNFGRIHEHFLSIDQEWELKQLTSIDGIWADWTGSTLYSPETVP